MSELDLRWEAFEYHTENKQDTFEEMCRRLFTAKYLKNTVIPHTDPNLAGIEVLPVLEPMRADGEERQYISFQAKYTDTVDGAYTQFKESAQKTVERYNGKLGRVYLFSNQTLSTANRRYQSIVEILNSANIECIPVCGDDLLDMLAEYKEIANNYFVDKTIRYSGKTSNYDRKSESVDNSLETAKTIRKLAENLWINWKTGCLAADPETAIYASEQGKDGKNAGTLSESEAGGEGKLLAELSPEEKHLISVLVQGEGAVVSWGEICERIGLTSAAADEDSAKKEAKKAVESFLAKAQALRAVIDPEKDENGCRISLCGWGSENSYGDNEKLEEDDWKSLKVGKGENDSNAEQYAKAWFRRYYAQLAESFENRITNARTDGMGGKVFGSYTMIAAYANARTYVDDGNQTETMLDRIGRWYRKKPERSGRVIVLHGQPGDGKTTFCKKAVYAHRFEGWLVEAPCVLRFSLNPSESDIITDGEAGKKRLDIMNAFCLRNPREKDRIYGLTDIPKDALVILDGYDELAARLGGVDFDEDERDDSVFNNFHKAVERLAEDYTLKVVITSRSMCIRREIREGLGTLEKDVKFAPLSHGQQEQMLARMAELEEEKADADELLAYRATLHTLWENEDMDRLLMIPALFRMIVACRFQDAKAGYSEAVLYSKLFHSLMTVLKGRTSQQVKYLLGEYEKIAAQIFNYQEDTCPFDKKPETDELIYLFLTKGDEGRLGFLHGSFRQFFLARYIVSGIQAAATAGKENREEFVKFFSSLRAARIEGDDEMAWTYMGQLAKMQGTASDPFGMAPITTKTVEGCLAMLNDARSFGEGIAREPVFTLDPKAEKGGLAGAENAVFNIVTALGILERACRREKDQTRIQYEKYENVCGYLRTGDYNGINLSCLDFGGANLGSAYLKDANLSGTNLAGTSFVGANLVGADLSGATLTGAVFKGANLSEAILENAMASDSAEKAVNFRKANLEGVKLRNAVLGRANCEGAVLTAADLSLAVLNGANLARADLSGACLASANLVGAHMKRACLIGAYLGRIHLDKTHLEETGSGVTDVYLCARLDEAHLEEACLDGAVLAGASLKGAHLERASLKGAYLCACPGAGEFKWNGKVCKADPKSDAVLKDASFVGTDFSGAFLSRKGYLFVKGCGGEKGPVLGLPKTIPNGELGLDSERYVEPLGKATVSSRTRADKVSGQAVARVSSGKLTVNPKTEEVIPYGVYQGDTLKWRVLRREYDKVLLVTEKLIDVRRYHRGLEPITWEDCELRSWMNEDFLREAFTEEERVRIAEVINQNPDNERFGTDGGRPTRDRVFALSIDEEEAYFKSDNDRAAFFTPQALMAYKDRGGYIEMRPNGETGSWWLRSPGFCHFEFHAACFQPGMTDYGHNVDDVHVAVRPAFWLNL